MILYPPLRPGIPFAPSWPKPEARKQSLIALDPVIMNGSIGEKPIEIKGKIPYPSII
jgi:hypothetical protein